MGLLALCDDTLRLLFHLCGLNFISLRSVCHFLKSLIDSRGVYFWNILASVSSDLQTAHLLQNKGTGLHIKRHVVNNLSRKSLEFCLDSMVFISSFPVIDLLHHKCKEISFVFNLKNVLYCACMSGDLPMVQYVVHRMVLRDICAVKADHEDSHRALCTSPERYINAWNTNTKIWRNSSQPLLLRCFDIACHANQLVLAQWIQSEFDVFEINNKKGGLGGFFVYVFCKVCARGFLPVAQWMFNQISPLDHMGIFYQVCVETSLEFRDWDFNAKVPMCILWLESVCTFSDEFISVVLSKHDGDPLLNNTLPQVVRWLGDIYPQCITEKTRQWIDKRRPKLKKRKIMACHDGFPSKMDIKLCFGCF